MRTVLARSLLPLFCVGLVAAGCGTEPAGTTSTGTTTAGTGTSTSPDETDSTAGPVDAKTGAPTVVDQEPEPVVEAAEVKVAIDKGLSWLREAQHESGGWGAGLHSRQNIRDPHAVKLDPATTAFVMLTLLRADGGRLDGTHATALRKGTGWLVAAVENGPKKGAQITTLRGTQPQTKLGASVDTAMAAQVLARILPLLDTQDALHARAKAALAVCTGKLEGSQQANGTWAGGGGWAPVLQASLANQALELSKRAGMDVDEQVLRRARNFQQGNIDVRGKTIGIGGAAGGNAGIELYSFAASGRGLASRAARADAIKRKAVAQGVLREKDALTPAAVSRVTDADVAEAEEIVDAGQKMRAQEERLGEAALLRGFGNNGGEEFLSYLLTSEALVIAGGETWTEWNERMGSRMTKIQTKDGSWTGHHCITSPVFCTAAVVQVLTVARDVAYLKSIAADEIERDENERDAKPSTNAK